MLDLDFIYRKQSRLIKLELEQVPGMAAMFDGILAR